MRDTFVFYRTMYNALKALPPEQMQEVLLAICEYALDGKEPPTAGLGRAMLEQCRMVIDESNARRDASKENGKLGGRPTANKESGDNLEEPSSNLEKPRTNLEEPNGNLGEPSETHNKKDIRDKDLNISVFQTSVVDESPTSADEKDKSVNSVPAPYKEIIDYLNQKTGKTFSFKSKDTRTKIKARLNEGYTVDDFKKVIDNMWERWKGDPKYVEYIRPATLFCGRFDNYLNTSPVPQSQTVQPQVNAKTNAFVFNETKRQRTKEEWLEIERQLLGVHK